MNHVTSGNGTSRHFALRINCVALGAKRTSGLRDLSTDQDQASQGRAGLIWVPYCADQRSGNCRRRRFQNSPVKVRCRHAALCSPMSLSRIARRSVSPLSVPTSSAPHEAAVALDIRCEDCDEASADCHRV
jgi:hypothetical protein